MKQTIYELMSKDVKLASINTDSGEVYIYSNLPIGLSLNDNPKSLSDYVANVSNFKEWCAGRILMMSQKHAKKICNSLALSQDISVDNKAAIAVAYHGSSLNDSYWLKEVDERLEYKDVSLFQNSSKNVLTPVSLRGISSSVFKKPLKNWTDIGVDGTLAKSWIREGGKYYLYKECDNADGEVLASKVLEAFGVKHVDYEKIEEDGFVMTRCRCFTNEDVGFVPFRSLVKEKDSFALDYIKSNFLSDYANLAVCTYLIGNEDLHDKNWGILIDGKGNISGLAPMFDFDGCFLYYKASAKLPFLPECKYISCNDTKSNNLEDDEGFEIDGITLKQAAIKYAPNCNIDFSKFDISIVPEQFREEFQNRLTEIIFEQEKHAPLEEADEEKI